ncbi:MAG: dihydroorotase [Bacteroides sp.]
MKRICVRNAFIINEGQIVKGSVIIENEQIAEVWVEGKDSLEPGDEVIDAEGCYLLPGVIDGHVHFRDPGLTQKADIASESKAAAAGGVTSFMDMPNTNPQTTTLDALEAKFELLASKSRVNYSCYFGATNNNYPMLGELDQHRVCGVKLFMGASTGDMLVDKMNSLKYIFQGTELLIAVHCEDQSTIKANTEKFSQEFAAQQVPLFEGDLPISYHAKIRSEEACFLSSHLAVQLAQETDARLHILHVSTARELSLFESALPLSQKRITAEACVAHLLFDFASYQELQSRIKCNPAIKTRHDRNSLRAAVNSNLVDVISTDHAPHLLKDKEGGALKAASGMPMIQFSLISMLELVNEGVFTLEKVIEKMCHAPAQIYAIRNRGYIRKGYQADLVLVRPDKEGWTLMADDVRSKCQWSPLEGRTFHWKVEKTFVNGHLLYADGEIDDDYRGQELRFR